ncbi:hypothetical protein swp_4856 [Shewanella piezotolerans WP3]|uniref:Uncharacterized protein n=1 Tax=Shewanella piezotolerans (strain WP3 / JCM 13877) TaxID=225849 RepID=B8CV02_SHEPW|nr:hypothetical protein [Shewanella piezotolerans]ACJ31478.1 hypothetical protein swp_4856 [Shewanella piezotolerans WP3]
MKLPTQSQPIERTTYQSSAAGMGANASLALTPMLAQTLYPYMNL